MNMTKVRKHALLSASGASRWMNCTPSAVLEESFQDTSSSFAQEGTIAHELADLILNYDMGFINRDELLLKNDALRKSEFYSPEMESEVEKYTAIVHEQLTAARKRTKDAILLIEQKVDLNEFIKEGFGTCDAVIIADGVIDITDLKYGKGVKVDATNNPQLKLYGLGALVKYDMLYDIHTVRLNIVQPRLDHYSTFEISVKDLVRWGQKEVKPLANLAFKGEGLQKAGSWCRWCKASARCATLAAQSLKVAKHKFADPHLLTDDQLMTVYKQQPQIADWINKVAAYVLSEALRGKDWKGYKLIEGRSNRKWLDETKVAETLVKEGYKDEEIHVKKLLGIGAIEKLLSKPMFAKILNKLVIKPQGKPALVEESDKRQAFGADRAKQVFK